MDYTLPLQDVCLAGEYKDAKACAAEGELNAISNPLLCEIKQVTCERNFGWEHKQDKQLKNCWSQVCIVEGEAQQLGQPLPHTYFLVC